MLDPAEVGTTLEPRRDGTELEAAGDVCEPPPLRLLLELEYGGVLKGALGEDNPVPRPKTAPEPKALEPPEDGGMLENAESKLVGVQLPVGTLTVETITLSASTPVVLQARSKSLLQYFIMIKQMVRG